MTNPTQLIAFRAEYIKEFELRESLIRNRVTTEAVVQGELAKFLVAGSGGATAVTRGANGKIPRRQVSRTQKTATLKEKHDVQEHSGFDIFGSQGDLKKVMMDSSMGVIYRDMDQDILSTLSTGTITTGAAQTGSLSLVNKVLTTLGNAKASGTADTITFLITPAFHSYLSELDSFSSADYVKESEMLLTQSTASNAFTWRGAMFIEHPELVGVGTNNATCYAFNRSAIGHAYNSSIMKVHAEYDAVDDVSIVAAHAYHGSVLLQNAGVIKIAHDDSAYSLS